MSFRDSERTWVTQMVVRINKLPSGAMPFATLPEKVKENTSDIEKIKETLHGNENTGEIGMCKKVNQMYRSWIISTVILKYIFPIISATIIILLGIIINKLFGN